MDNHGVPAALIDEYVAAEKKLDQLKKAVSEVALANIGMKRGDLVEDTSSGLHYALDWCSAYIANGTVNVSVMGKRVWKSGRKAGQRAYSSSFLSFNFIKKVEEDV